MKPTIALKSFEAPSAEQHVMVTTTPPMAIAGQLASTAANTPRRKLPIKWDETGKPMPVLPQPINVEAPDSWNHWGLNE